MSQEMVTVAVGPKEEMIIETEIHNRRTQLAANVIGYLAWSMTLAVISLPALWLFFPQYPQLLVLVSLDVLPVLSAWLYPVLCRRGWESIGIRFFLLSVLFMLAVQFPYVPELMSPIILVYVVFIITSNLLLGAKAGLWLGVLSTIFLLADIVLIETVARGRFPPLPPTVTLIINVSFSMLLFLLIVRTVYQIVEGQDNYYRQSRRAEMEVEQRIAFEQEQRKRLQRANREIKAVANLSGRLNAILDFDQLLQVLVDQVQERFGYYYVYVYLLDDERQQLVMQAGVGEAGEKMKAQGYKIPLAAKISLAARATRLGEVVSVDNVREAEDWLPNSLLPNTCSEMVVPIIREDQVVGVLGVQSDQVAGLDETNADVLRSLANQVGVALSNAQLFEQITQANVEISILNERLQAENLRMVAELDVTRRLQQMLLPTQEELAQVESLEIAGFMEPADEVGGDYYDVLQRNGQLKIGIGDVTGHGLESGVVMLMLQTAVRTLLTSGERDPARFMDVLNQTLHANMQRMDVDKSLSLALLDYDRAGKLRLSGQHEQLIVVRQGGRVELVDTLDLGLPVGLVEGIADFVGELCVELEPGDGVVLYSDGFTEAENEAGEFYGLERLCAVVSQHWAGSAEEIKEAVVRDARGFIGKQMVYDDLTLLVVKQK
jgi:serine phosphatase RsbU (regulator of sigma subunit)